MLRRVTGLVPVEFWGHAFRTTGVDVTIAPPFAGRVVGIRLFHEPRRDHRTQ
jgi:hypothetical protein